MTPLDLLNAGLSRRGMNFFDTADVCQQVIGGKHCWDMFGWAVPDDAVDDFESIWLSGDDGKLKDCDYVCVGWED